MVIVRVGTAIVAVPFLFGVAWIGGPVYGLVITAACVLAALEARSMLRAGGYAPLDSVLIGVSAFLPFDAWFLVARERGVPVFRPEGMELLGFAVIASLVILLVRRGPSPTMIDWALSIAFALYIGGLMQFYAPLRDRPDGAIWAIVTVGLSFVCDSTAFFVGRAWGRTRLAPEISPKKSVEGAIGGMLVTPVVGAAFALWAGYPPLVLAGLGISVAAATIAGDLVESLLKRQVGAKDSGVIIPGHGGILDRMDSLLFCAPVAVLYLQAVG